MFITTANTRPFRLVFRPLLNAKNTISSNMSNSTQKRARDSLDESDKAGKFVRVASVYREFISTEHPIFKPEAGRYHLYISLACPWANGTYLALKMKGLEDIIGVSVSHYTWNRTKPNDPEDKHGGWVFRSPDDEPVVPISGYGSQSCAGCVPDTVNGAVTVRDLYELSNDTGGKFTVPVLWDKKTKTIVNNESTEILRMFNSSFNHLLPADSPQRALDLYPSELEDKITEANSWIYPNINNGVYRAGFAKSQEAYNEAVDQVFEALDKAEEILASSRYICGSKFTGMDIRLFMTLVRFDEVYVVYFKCNKRFLSSYHHITNYMRELYQMPAIQSVINMDHIKGHYFTSHPVLNAYSIIPDGPNTLANLLLPHDRA